MCSSRTRHTQSAACTGAQVRRPWWIKHAAAEVLFQSHLLYMVTGAAGASISHKALLWGWQRLQQHC